MVEEGIAPAYRRDLESVAVTLPLLKLAARRAVDSARADHMDLNILEALMTDPVVAARIEQELPRIIERHQSRGGALAPALASWPASWLQAPIRGGSIFSEPTPVPPSASLASMHPSGSTPPAESASLAATPSQKSKQTAAGIHTGKAGTKKEKKKEGRSSTSTRDVIPDSALRVAHEEEQGEQQQQQQQQQQQGEGVQEEDQGERGPISELSADIPVWQREGMAVPRAGDPILGDISPQTLAHMVRSAGSDPDDLLRVIWSSPHRRVRQLLLRECLISIDEKGPERKDLPPGYWALAESLEALLAAMDREDASEGGGEEPPTLPAGHTNVLAATAEEREARCGSHPAWPDGTHCRLCGRWNPSGRKTNKSACWRWGGSVVNKKAKADLFPPSCHTCSYQWDKLPHTDPTRFAEVAATLGREWPASERRFLQWNNRDLLRDDEDSSAYWQNFKNEKDEATWLQMKRSEMVAQRRAYRITSQQSCSPPEESSTKGTPSPSPPGHAVPSLAIGVIPTATSGSNIIISTTKTVATTAAHLAADSEQHAPSAGPLQSTIAAVAEAEDNNPPPKKRQRTKPARKQQKGNKKALPKGI
ncbi:hypothetical protein A4X13_0g7396 [Tilletia indica]|uniref:Uncharacterized protein n=1 Tax=Tilletia indica TaxID=43049 RepID=A0A177T968_9BASI|nr:hypothetical protein A4X13_0g7396 [Tilletia indica]